MATTINFAGVDALGQLTGTPRDHVKGLADLSRFRPGSRWFSPITYFWADYYNGATSKWAAALAAGDALGFTILNINSGCGPAQDKDWVEQAARAKAAGSRVLGYVRTTYGKRPQAEVMQEIANHVAWYGVAGVFLDEAVNGWGDQSSLVAYYQQLYPAIKAIYGEAFTVVMNPGSNTVEDMVKCSDVPMTYESYAETYLNPGTTTITPDFYYRYPASKFWHVVHNVTEANYRQVMDQAATMHAGHICLTDLRFTPSSDPQNPTENPYAGPPSQWLIDIQTAWARGVLGEHQQMLDVKTQLASFASQLNATTGTGTVPTGDAPTSNYDADGNLILS